MSALAAVAEQGLAVLDTWNQTTELWQYHRDNGHGYECSHYCFPSAPQVRMGFVACGAPLDRAAVPALLC